MALSRRPRVPIALLVILSGALLVGLAAAFLTAAPETPTNGAQPATTSSPDLVGALAVALVAGLVLAVLLNYLMGGRAPLPSRYVATLLMSVLLLLLFVVAARLFAHGIALGPSSPSTAGNSTSPPPSPPSSGLPVPSGPIFPGLGPPGWFLLLGIVGTVVVLILLFPLIAKARARRSEVPPAPVARLAETVQAALKEIEGRPSDARSAIVRFYGELLDAVRPRVHSLETMTTGEVESICVRSFGLSPPVARELTGLFEEARYSVHPMSEAEVGRARIALGDALRELQAPAPIP